MQDTIESVESRLKNVLLRSVSQPLDSSQLDSNVALIRQGIGLDSVALLEFVVGIENEFNILLDEGDITLDSFGSLGNLASVICRKLNAAKPA